MRDESKSRFWKNGVAMYWCTGIGWSQRGVGGGKQGFGFGYIKMPKRHIQVKM